MAEFRELEYLRELAKRYNAHYFKSYFGFTMKQFADRLGIKKNSFSEILSGKHKLKEKYREPFIQAFKELQVEEKTKDFKESPQQLSMRALLKSMKKSLTILILCCIFNSMETNWLYYIGVQRRVSSLSGNIYKAVVNAILTAAFFYLHRDSTQSQAKVGLAFLF